MESVDKIEFKIKIMCVKDLTIPEGTPLKVQWARGSQKVETNTQLVLATKRAYFQQKFSIKTGIKSIDDIK